MGATFVMARLHVAWNSLETSLYSEVPATTGKALAVVLAGMVSQCSGMSSSVGINQKFGLQNQLTELGSRPATQSLQ